ncbi:hypothetical protein CEXT_251301 [Caerostris extrusa]|uniref:Uncharacterized protein n=1 Tax=Caerostris extrusa TaxID=172846 RepID=A0AAV4QD68_CAEEX|nr:hypothetical protein CEXT_251301 [Caerostris extrusa]
MHLDIACFIGKFPFSVRYFPLRHAPASSCDVTGVGNVPFCGRRLLFLPRPRRHYYFLKTTPLTNFENFQEMLQKISKSSIYLNTEFMRGHLTVLISAMIIAVCVCRVMSDPFLDKNVHVGIFPIKSAKDCYLNANAVRRPESQKVNTTFNITLSGNTVLPKGFLRGLIVGQLCIDDPQTEVLEDGAFEGVLHLERIAVQISSMQEFSGKRMVTFGVQPGPLPGPERSRSPHHHHQAG